MSRCELTDLPADMCAHCLGHKDTEQQAAVGREVLLNRGWLAAKFRGRCSDCGEWYEAGTAIRRDGNGWLAECCAEEGR